MHLLSLYSLFVIQILGFDIKTEKINPYEIDDTLVNIQNHKNLHLKLAEETIQICFHNTNNLTKGGKDPKKLNLTLDEIVNKENNTDQLTSKLNDLLELGQLFGINNLKHGYPRSILEYISGKVNMEILERKIKDTFKSSNCSRGSRESNSETFLHAYREIFENEYSLQFHSNKLDKEKYKELREQFLTLWRHMEGQAIKQSNICYGYHENRPQYQKELDENKDKQWIQNGLRILFADFEAKKNSLYLTEAELFNDIKISVFAPHEESKITSKWEASSGLLLHLSEAILGCALILKAFNNESQIPQNLKKILEEFKLTVKTHKKYLRNKNMTPNLEYAAKEFFKSSDIEFDEKDGLFKQKNERDVFSREPLTKNIPNECFAEAKKEKFKWHRYLVHIHISLVVFAILVSAVIKKLISIKMK
jgi:hypothetical protein